MKGEELDVLLTLVSGRARYIKGGEEDDGRTASKGKSRKQERCRVYNDGTRDQE